CSFQYTAFNHKFCTLCLAPLNSCQVIFDSISVDERTDMVAGVQRIPDTELPVGAHQPVFEVFIDTFVNDQSAGTGAALSGGAYRPEYSRRQSDVQIRMLRNDDGIVSTQLQNTFPES